MNGADQPLAADELESRMQSLVFMVLTTRRSVEATALALARWPRPVQERFLQSIEFIATTSVELAFNFCMFATPSLRVVDEADWQDWVLHLMDIYDSRGVLPCIVAMQKVDEYVRSHCGGQQGVLFEEVSRILQPFVCGLSGRPLKLAIHEDAYTDTETLYLPPKVDRFPQREDNYRLCKSMAVHLWAQTWFGSWRLPVAGLIRGFDDEQRALCLFHALETRRLDACIARELPGISRVMRALRPDVAESVSSVLWRGAVERLRLPDATVRDSADLLGQLYPEAPVPQPFCYQGVLIPERTEAAMALRQRRESRALEQALAVIAGEHRLGRPESADPAAHDGDGFDARQVPDPDWPGGFRMELRFSGEPVSPSQDVQQLIESVLQDFGDIPSEYLEAAGHGQYRVGSEGGAGEGGKPSGDASAHLYDEWDHVRQHYRKEWCLLRERDVHPVRDGFVDQTLSKHRGLLKHLYRTFEALRGEDRTLRRQPFGDDIDIDAVVESYVDRCVGLEAPERLFTKKRREDRSIAVMFMVDMSGSTKGWINDIEREALVLLCESLEILGDRYAIYGFSGFTHKRCELLRVKEFDEPYNEAVRARISGIRPQDYTRMGAAIRHLTRLLGEVEARTKLLITLSDGRPDDQDGYRGVYGIEDTRQALLEARYQGVHPFCITIDDEALDYLPHMYGPVSFTLINEVEQLPFKVSDIYRRITM